MPESYLFQAQNKHATTSGEPPRIDANAPNRYHSYFENDVGE